MKPDPFISCSVILRSLFFRRSVAKPEGMVGLGLSDFSMLCENQSSLTLLIFLLIFWLRLFRNARVYVG